MYGVKLLRGSFDIATRYNPEKFTEAKWLQRILFLETVAGLEAFVTCGWGYCCLWSDHFPFIGVLKLFGP